MNSCSTREKSCSTRLFSQHDFSRVQHESQSTYSSVKTRLAEYEWYSYKQTSREHEKSRVEHEKSRVEHEKSRVARKG